MMRGMRAFVAAAAFCMAMTLLVPGAKGTITDDIDPLGSSVRVVLYNPESGGSSGTVTIVADLGGSQPYTKTKPFNVGGGEYTSVTAIFPAPVLEIISVGITEGPDPIP